MVKILIGGGCEEAVEKKCLTSINVFDTDHFSFSLFSSFKMPRRGGSLHKFGDNIIVLGGCAGYKNHLDTIEIYKDDKWNLIENVKLPYEVSCFTSCSISSKSAIILGGFNGLECVNDVIKINYDDNKIEVMALPKLCTRLKNSACTYNNNNKIILFGGWDEERTLKTIFEYDFEKQKTLMEGLMPQTLEGHTITNIFNDNKFAIIIGGYDGINVVNDIYLYNYQTHKMEKLKVSLKMRRENHTVEYDNNKKLLFVFNGWNGNEALGLVEIFDVVLGDPWLIHKEEIYSNYKRNKPCSLIL
uniref:Kelch protein n=1 Tax=Parastrongyloides trichosuri TaxID=131310 RepID=A0A0N4Z610_PARTI